MLPLFIVRDHREAGTKEISGVVVNLRAHRMGGLDEDSAGRQSGIQF